jgi:hypothetical protein
MFYVNASLYIIFNHNKDDYCFMKIIVSNCFITFEIFTIFLVLRELLQVNFCDIKLINFLNNKNYYKNY